MSTALIVVDGVLRKLMGGLPIPEGIRLYLSLAATGRIILLGQDDAPQVVDWLELHGCNKHDFVHLCPGDFTMAHHANQLRREGYDIDLAVVPDPLMATALLAVGFNTMLFTHAQYAQPSWRPDTPKGVRPWTEITTQVADQARMKAEDERLRDND